MIGRWHFEWADNAFVAPGWYAARIVGTAHYQARRKAKGLISSIKKLNILADDADGDSISPAF